MFHPKVSFGGVPLFLISTRKVGFFSFMADPNLKGEKRPADVIHARPHRRLRAAK